MGYHAQIREEALWAIFDIKGDAKAVAKRLSRLNLSLPARANTANEKDGQYLCWIGEGHWLLLAPGESEFQFLERLAPHDPSTDCRIVHVSDAYSLFTVTGKQVDDILAIASPLDTRQKKFPPDGVGFTELFGIRGLVLRRTDGYLIGVERSYSDMISVYFKKILTGKC